MTDLLQFGATLCHLAAVLGSLWIVAEVVAPKFGAA